MAIGLRITDALTDSNLIGLPMALYYYLWHELLNPKDFQPVKHEAIAARWRVSTDTVARTLRVLVDLGYLEQGPQPRPGEMRMYRLVWRRVPEELRDTA